MTMGGRLYVGKRNFSPSRRRASGFPVRAANFLAFNADCVAETSLDEALIMPPKKPSERRKQNGAGYACRERRQLPPRARRAAALRELYRPRCEPRARHLRWRAWRLRV